MPTSGTEKVPGWSEIWTLGSDTNPNVTSPTVALRGPSIYGQQEVEVVPKLEAEQRIERVRQSVLSEVKEGLLGEEALEAVARVCHGGPQESFDYVDGEDREFALEGARRIAEAALATITPEEEK